MTNRKVEMLFFFKKCIRFQGCSFSVSGLRHQSADNLELYVNLCSRRFSLVTTIGRGLGLTLFVSKISRFGLKAVTSNVIDLEHRSCGVAGRTSTTRR